MYVYIYNKCLEFLARPCAYLFIYQNRHIFYRREFPCKGVFFYILSCAPFPGPSVLFVGEGFLGRRCWDSCVEMLYVGSLVPGLEALGLLEASVGFALGNALFLVRG